MAEDPPISLLLRYELCTEGSLDGSLSSRRNRGRLSRGRFVVVVEARAEPPEVEVSGMVEDSWFSLGKSLDLSPLLAALVLATSLRARPL